MAKAKGLGMGLDALLGKDINMGSDQDRADTLPTASLQPGRYQPRTRMDQQSLESLAASIRQQGVLQPILVRKVEGGAYEILAGERRWRAAQRAGLQSVPVLVRNIPDEAALAVGLIENIQRENLNPLEEALGVKRLIEEFGLTHEKAALAVGRSRSAVSNLLRLLELDDGVRSLLMDGKIEMGHARALLSLPPRLQNEVARQVESRGLSARETEERVRRLQGQVPAKGRSTAGKPGRDVLALQEELSDRLGATVTVKPAGKGGTLTIRYHSLDQLDGILSLLRGR
jgi:ParB family chromosome partitioning protein